MVTLNWFINDMESRTRVEIVRLDDESRLFKAVKTKEDSKAFRKDMVMMGNSIMSIIMKTGF